MSVNKDQVQGRVEELKGKAKEVAGAVIGDHVLQDKGVAQKDIGSVRAAAGDLKQDIKQDVKKPA